MVIGLWPLFVLENFNAFNYAARAVLAHAHQYWCSLWHCGFLVYSSIQTVFIEPNRHLVKAATATQSQEARQ